MSATIVRTAAALNLSKSCAALVLCAMIASCGGGSGGGNAGAPNLGAAVDGTNLQPQIDSISLGCDLVLDSIGIGAGEVTNFTLFVDDESPLTLAYSIVSDDESVSISSVDETGVFSLEGISAGQTTMPITVTDEHGLSSQLLLSVIVDG